MYFPFKSMQISFISKVGYDSRERNKFMFHHLVWFLEFDPGQPGWNGPYEQKTKFDLLTEAARLPGSYEEALSRDKRSRINA